MRYNFVLNFLSILRVGSVQRMYKEGSDRTLLEPIQATAVHWSGVMSFSKTWEFLHIVQIVYRTVTVQFTLSIIPTNKPTVYPRTVLGQCDTFHWQLKTVEHIYGRVVSSSSQLTADCWSAVMLKADKTGTVLYCAGVYRCGATERGNVLVVLVGAEG